MPLEPAYERRGDDRHDCADGDRIDDRRGEAQYPDEADQQDEQAHEKPRHEAEIAQPHRRPKHAGEVARLERVRRQQSNRLSRGLALSSVKQPHPPDRSLRFGR